MKISTKVLCSAGVLLCSNDVLAEGELVAHP